MTVRRTPTTDKVFTPGSLLVAHVYLFPVQLYTPRRIWVITQKLILKSEQLKCDSKIYTAILEKRKSIKY